MALLGVGATPPPGGNPGSTTANIVHPVLMSKEHGQVGRICDGKNFLDISKLVQIICEILK